MSEKYPWTLEEMEAMIDQMMPQFNGMPKWFGIVWLGGLLSYATQDRSDDPICRHIAARLIEYGFDGFDDLRPTI